MRLLNAARHWFWLAPAILGIVFIASGVYMILQGQDAKDEVRDAIYRENITTSEDASIPNQRVDDADTATAQAEVIEGHVLKITGGKTYAELDREDPNRPVVLNSVSLRTALNMAVMGFKVSDHVAGMGVFMVVIGITHILFLAPAVYWAA
ncbi:MAG: hypothetical protein Q7R32_10570, partial [Dehalococcoidia bacterium]|nr:hypothetical protein [Dehalococcoidia bacterium]